MTHVCEWLEEKCGSCVTIICRNNELSSMMSWVCCLLKYWEIFILFVENSQIVLKISVIPILLTFICLVVLNLLVNNQLNLLSNLSFWHIVVTMVSALNPLFFYLNLAFDNFKASLQYTVCNCFLLVLKTKHQKIQLKGGGRTQFSALLNSVCAYWIVEHGADLAWAEIPWQGHEATWGCYYQIMFLHL